MKIKNLIIGFGLPVYMTLLAVLDVGKEKPASENTHYTGEFPLALFVFTFSIAGLAYYAGYTTEKGVKL